MNAHARSFVSLSPPKRGEGRGEGTAKSMGEYKQLARQLRREQTDEEKQLWKELRGRRFAGFKFRRQHIVEEHILDFYCSDAKLAVELDGFQHGLPEGIQRDGVREKFLAEQEIESIRFWNHQ